MQWSLAIGRIAGTAIRIPVTFLLFLLRIAITAESATVPGAWGSPKWSSKSVPSTPQQVFCNAHYGRSGGGRKEPHHRSFNRLY